MGLRGTDLQHGATESRFFWLPAMLTFWYCITSILLGVILHFPVKKFMLAITINRQQNKVQRQLNAAELAALQRKVTIMAVIIAVTFAFLYNKVIMLKFFKG